MSETRFSDQFLARRWSSLSLLAVALVAAPAGYWMGRAGSRGGPEAALVVPREPSPTAPVASLSHPSPEPPTERVPRPPDPASLAPKFSQAAWEQRWQDITQEGDTPARDERLAAALQELATHDHERAIAIALAQPELTLRHQLLQASLRGWGSAAPSAAADWAMQRDEATRSAAVEAVLTGAARQPEAAVRLAQRLCAEDAGFATGYGHAVITALSGQGSFAAAARFAAESNTDDRPIWIDSAYYQWARHQPEQALAAAETIADPAVRRNALSGLIVGWSQANPARASAYAVRLPPGEDRSNAITQALPEWVRSDPVAAAQWMNSVAPHPDFDAGAAAVANLSTLVAAEPQTAIAWAERIREPGLRVSTLRSVTGQWAQSDRSAAARYVASSTTLSNDQRREIMESLSPAP